LPAEALGALAPEGAGTEPPTAGLLAGSVPRSSQHPAHRALHRTVAHRFKNLWRD